MENHRLKKLDSELQEKKQKNELLQQKLKDYEDTLDELIDFESKKRCKELEKVTIILRQRKLHSSCF